MIDDYDESSGWMFLLVPAHPGFPGQIPQSRKTVVCVCVQEQCTGKVENWPKLGQRWGFKGLQILMGSPSKLWTQFLKLHLYLSFWAIKVASWSSDLDH